VIATLALFLWQVRHERHMDAGAEKTEAPVLDRSHPSGDHS